MTKTNISIPDFGYTLGQRVVVVEPQIKATVRAVLSDLDGIQYKISFWTDGIRYETWVSADELKSVTVEKTISIP